MQILRRVAVLLAAIALCAPAAALGQTQTIAPGGQGVSTQPPVQLDGGKQPTGTEIPRPPSTPPPPPPTTPAPGHDLPNTGTDPRLLFLVGVALALLGVGLRLRTADAELY